MRIGGGGKAPPLTMVRPKMVSPMSREMRTKSGDLIFRSSNKIASLNFTSADIFNCFAGLNYAQQNGGQIYLWPTNEKYMQPNMYNVARMYRNYRIISATLEYVPRVNVSTGNCVMFCTYSDDPEYFASAGATNGTANLSEGMMTNSDRCSSWPAWKPMVCQHFLIRNCYFRMEYQ